MPVARVLTSKNGHQIGIEISPIGQPATFEWLKRTGSDDAKCVDTDYNDVIPASAGQELAPVSRIS